MKATLGMGFEERSEAFDFGVALQDARKVLGFEGPGGVAVKAGGGLEKGKVVEKQEDEKRDYSLKEGETITVKLGTRARRGRQAGLNGVDGDGQDAAALFSINPPPPPYNWDPGIDGGSFLPPPPSASEVKEEMRRLSPQRKKLAQTAQELGFDDGEFGEFQ